MVSLNPYCAEGVKYREEAITVSPKVSLRVITFHPPQKNKDPIIVFVAGWISNITAWQEVLRDMTKHFKVIYIETREKTSSLVTGKVEYGVQAIGNDLATLVEYFDLREESYILFGSSLGATAILDCCRLLNRHPKALVLIGPNAVFRVPKTGMIVIRMFPPFFYLLIKPIVKWYLKSFRLDIKSDYAQYKKYCDALDAADPWKLKKGVISLSKYRLWDLLPDIKYPTLIIGASKDVLHEPENLNKISALLPNATYLDMETNKNTHSAKVVKEMRKYFSKLNI